MRSRLSPMAASFLLPSEQELEPDDAAPERRTVRYWITFGILDLFPDAVDLNLCEPVERPVGAQRQDMLRFEEDGFRPRVAERRILAGLAVVPDPLDPRCHFQAAHAPVKQRRLGPERPALGFAGDHPGAADVPGVSQRIGQILIADPLRRTGVADARVLRAQRC